MEGLRYGQALILDAARVKHFPGVAPAADATDERPPVDATVRAQDLAPFRSAIRAGVRCVMTSNAFYDGARFRATISPSIVRAAPVERWARQAIRAGADLVLFTSPAHARRALAALLPLARAGELDVSVERVLRYRSRLRGAPRP